MRKLLVLCLVAVAFVGGACGGSDRKPVAVLAAATERTIDAKTSRVAMEIEMPSPTGGDTVTLNAEGLFDYVTQKGTMSLDMSALGIPGMSGKAEMVLLGQVFYMKLPAGLLPGKPWLKVDVNALGQARGIDLGGLQQLGSNDPGTQLRYFTGAGDDTKKVGEEKVRGVDTTHYRGQFDLNKAKADAPADLKDDFDRFIEQLGSSSFPGDVWVDGDDLIRRVRMTITPKGTGASPTSGSLTTTQEFYDFGVKVDATPPPADQVSDFAQLLQSAGQG